MVYQWVNFVQETNSWWLRRVRPVWLPLALAYLGYYSYRYYFFGKWAVYTKNQLSEDDLIRSAQENKRNWGYASWYVPELARSRKRQMQEVQGENYRHANKWEDMYCYDMRTLPQILEDENNWE